MSNENTPLDSGKLKSAYGDAIADIKKAFRHINAKRLVLLLAIGFFIVYTLTGIYVVNPGEQAVIKRFGKALNETKSEGLHYRFPYPIEEVQKVNLVEIRRAEIGMNIPDHFHDDTDIPDTIELLTGDENIITFEGIVHYRVKDAFEFLFNANMNSEQLVRYAAEASLVHLVSRTAVDDILSTEKVEAQNFIVGLSQSILDSYNSGLQITSFNIQSIVPPNTVADAFRAVTNAREAREMAISRAQGYYNSLLPTARSESNKMLTEAETYRTEQINRAAGDTEKFLGMLAEYQRSGNASVRNTTRYRLLLETLERTMPKAKLYIVDSKDNSIDIRLLDMDVISGGQPTSGAGGLHAH